MFSGADFCLGVTAESRTMAEAFLSPRAVFTADSRYEVRIRVTGPSGALLAVDWGDGTVSMWEGEELAHRYATDGVMVVTLSDDAEPTFVHGITSIAKMDYSTLRPGVFMDCATLESVADGAFDSLTAVPGYLFSGCCRLGGALLFPSARSIGEDSFAMHKYDSARPGVTVSLPLYSSDSVPADAFDGANLSACPFRESTIVSVGEFALYGNPEMTTFPFGAVETIGRGAFGDTGLTHVDSGASSVGVEAFSECTNLVELRLDRLADGAGYLAIGCESLEELVLPAFNGSVLDLGIHEIGSGSLAFINISSATDIPDTVVLDCSQPVGFLSMYGGLRELQVGVPSGMVPENMYGAPPGCIIVCADGETITVGQD